MESKSNYALAITSTGEYSICNSDMPPGIVDAWDNERQVSLTIYIAPQKEIDKILDIEESLVGANYGYVRNILRTLQDKQEAILKWYKK